MKMRVFILAFALIGSVLIGRAVAYVFDPTTGQQIVQCASGCSGGSGGAVTIANGADVAEGNTADSQATNATSSWSVVALLKGLWTLLNTIATNTAAAIPAGTATIGGVFNGYNTYNTVAASQTAQALTGGSGGAVGDYLSHCVALPTSTSPGVVTILDNSTAVFSFPGGASSLSNLVPFSIPIAALSVSGAWKVTTGTAITVTCVGKFH